MSNRTYICIDCRTARRAEAAGWVATSLRCAACGGSLWELSHKWRIPRKDDDKEWNALREIILAEAPTREQYLERRGNELIEQIDKRMVALENRKIFAGRAAGLKRLRNEKQRIADLYFRRHSHQAEKAPAKTERFSRGKTSSQVP